MKRNIITVIIGVVLCLGLTIPVIAARTQTDWLLERIADNKGLGVVTWNNATGITATYSASYAVTATLAVSTDEVFTTASSYGAEQTMLTVTVTGAMLATVSWASDVFTIDCAAGPSAVGTQGVATCSTGTGVSIGACDALIQALDCVSGDDAALITVDWATKFDAAGYQAYGNAEMGKETAGAVANSATPYVILAEAAFLHDSALLDCTNKSIDACETLFESMWEGDVNTWVTVDGWNSDLANGFNDVANLGAASYTAADSGLEIPMTAGGAAIDYLEEDRFTSVGYISAQCNYTTKCNVKLFDGTTQIWESANMTDNVPMTYSFNPPVLASTGNYLTVQVYSSDTIATVTNMYVIGRTD